MYGRSEQQNRAEWSQELERVRVLGEGASAVSYLCIWTSSAGEKRHVVVKQYKHSFTEDASNRLWREVDVLESIQHERIPAYIGHYITEQDGRRLLCLIVDYIEGTSLEKAMRTCRWTLHESLQIIHQLLQIVVYLQSLQPSILHRDIKPSNILVSHQDEVWTVYLIDFGTAIDAIHRTLGATHNVGTIGYMAPEQIVGNPEEASDVYSVGVVAWELLTRQRAKDNLVGMSLEWHVKASRLPHSLITWLEELLDEMVDTRVQSALEAMDSLERIPEFDDEQITILIPEGVRDWKCEAVRRWLVISEQKRDPRQAACQWLRDFGDRCNDGELIGLYHVLHRVSLKQSSFRIVEYIQDLVLATPNGSLLLSDLQENILTTQRLQTRLETLPKWRVFGIAKMNNKIRYTRECIKQLQENLFNATKVWMEYVNADPKDLFRLLTADRTLSQPEVNEQYIHMREHSIGMVQIPSLSTGTVFISKLLVTQELFEVVMGYNPSMHKGLLHPVETVSWWDAVIFCNRLSERCGLMPAYRIADGNVDVLEGDGFRLPLWKDWKMAARSQRMHRFSGAEDADLVGWVNNSSRSTKRVAQKEPNNWDIYDMTGNVAEWCWDETNDIGACGHRLTAGGSFRDPLEWVRIDAYNFEDPHFSSLDLGFRISRRLEQ